MLTKLFAGAVEAGFEGDDADAVDIGHFLLGAAFLGKGDESAVGGFEFGEGVAEGVELLAVDGRRGFGDLEMFFLFEG